MLLRHMYPRIFLLFISMLIGQSSRSQTYLENLPLIPLPKTVQAGTGVFKLDAQLKITFSDEGAKAEAEFLSEFLENTYGLRLKITSARKASKGAIHFERTALAAVTSASAYELQVDSSRIILKSADREGLFYAIQTLIQLLPAGKVNVPQVPAIHIRDEPGYKWRGMHLDVSRHFFSIDFIKRYLDFLAMYKLNVFHWHLTDDQGWRIDIRNYPRLREIAAFRNQTLVGHLRDQPPAFDSTRYGGYYSKSEIKEIVEYAARRHITIVPEIEMPGHAMAALAAYPELSCSGGPFDVAERWGIFEDVFCPKPETFEFLENVLNEVCELFPGKFIHIGGDECPKIRWKNCSHCQQLMSDHGFESEEELQAYFIGKIAAFLKTKNKRIIGWDEILDGEIPADAAIMSWRGNRGGIKAARLNHDVVMAPTSHCYFDFYQSDYQEEPLAIGEFLPLEKVYAFNPIPEGLNELEAKRILGAQGNVWTEYMKDEKQVEYMAMPRMAALAEVLWTAAEQRDFDKFSRRLVSHFKLLDFRQVNYSKALFDIRVNSLANPDKRSVSFELYSPFKLGTIRYSINGDEPSLSSSIYSLPIKIDQSIGIRAQIFDGPVPRGRELSKVVRMNLATGKDVQSVYTPHEDYSRSGMFALVNGLYGRIPWVGHEWLGFSGVPLDVTIDLGSVLTISQVYADVLKDELSHIYLPGSFEVMVSDDGSNFTSVGKQKVDLNPGERLLVLKFPKTGARYVRILLSNFGVIPDDEPGAGRPAWLFVDEVGIE